MARASVNARKITFVLTQATQLANTSKASNVSSVPLGINFSRRVLRLQLGFSVPIEFFLVVSISSLRLFGLFLSSLGSLHVVEVFLLASYVRYHVTLH